MYAIEHETKKLMIALTMIVVTLMHATPAHAAGKPTAPPPPLTLSEWRLAEEMSGCGPTGTGVCSADMAADGYIATLQPVLSVVDPVDPAPMAIYGQKFARFEQTATQTLTKSMRSATYEWRFVVDAPIEAVQQGSLGTMSSSVQIETDDERDDCHSFYLPVYVMSEEDTTIPAGTTYTARYTFAPCPGMRSIPAGTTFALTAAVWLNLSIDGTSGDNELWNGRADLTGTIRSVVTSNCC